MANKKELLIKHTCSECVLKWRDTKPINMDINGSPFAWRCPFDNFIRLDNFEACNNIKLK